jgi:hypothetical protein
MPDPRTIKTKMLKLFESLEGIRALKENERENFKKRLMALTPPQMKAMITFLQKEKKEVAELKKRMEEQDQKMLILISKLKQANQNLKKVFLRSEEKEEKKADSKKAEELLAGLD